MFQILSVISIENLQQFLLITNTTSFQVLFLQCIIRVVSRSLADAAREAGCTLGAFIATSLRHICIKLRRRARPRPTEMHYTARFDELPVQFRG